MSEALVVDASSILAAAMPDEGSAYGHALLDVVVRGRAVVPAVFWYEVRNALIVGERRGRATPASTAAFLGVLAELPIEIDTPTSSDPGVGVLDAARSHQLSVYDAAYLDLASRRGLPLATLDRALSQAAAKAGVNLFRGSAE